MDGRWNGVRAFPQPQTVLPFAQGRIGGTLVNEPVRAKPLAAGTKVLIFSAQSAEHKEIKSILKTDAGTKLEWTAPIKGNLARPRPDLTDGSSAYSAARLPHSL